MGEFKNKNDTETNNPVKREPWEIIYGRPRTEEQALELQASFVRKRMNLGEDDRIGGLGAGVQYMVYELPDDRVFKVARTNDSAWAKYRSYDSNDEDEFNGIISAREVSVEYVSKLISMKPEISYIFGNPKFNGEQDAMGAYEQDKLKVYGEDNFNLLPDEDQIKYINDYINLTKLMWMYGCSDKILNFQANTGLDKDGRIIMADFGEINTTKEEAKNTVRSERWNHAWGMWCLKDNIQDVARHMFETELTEDAIDELWGKNL